LSAPVAEAYVAAGSNVRPRASLLKALALLEGEFRGLRVSRAIANPAVGFTGDDFINLVVAFAAPLPTEELLDRLKRIESECGREPGAPKWGPRTLDLDLLLHGERTGPVAGKTLPHPDLLTRAWVLGPLAELAPGLVHPVAAERIDSLWNRFDRRAHPLTPVELEGGEA
jgi:2-amino-4-hydroxy-6-hydroxymethyldihydropteridine diphosphokinase